MLLSHGTQVSFFAVRTADSCWLGLLSLFCLPPLRPLHLWLIFQFRLEHANTLRRQPTVSRTLWNNSPKSMECYTENTWVEVAHGRGLGWVPLDRGCRAITTYPMDESKSKKTWKSNVPVAMTDADRPHEALEAVWNEIIHTRNCRWSKRSKLTFYKRDLRFTQRWWHGFWPPGLLHTVAEVLSVDVSNEPLPSLWRVRTQQPCYSADRPRTPEPIPHLHIYLYTRDDASISFVDHNTLRHQHHCKVTVTSPQHKLL